MLSIAAYYFPGNTTAKVNENSLGMRILRLQCKSLYLHARGFHGRNWGKFRLSPLRIETRRGRSDPPGKTSRERECFVRSNPGAIRADLSEISRFVSQVYEGYRCSAIRTRFASNEDKCHVLPIFHLWPFLL